MNIGEVAKRSGTNAKTIRYYEQQGLLASARRGENGYRIYADDDVHRLSFIRRARSLGFSVKDVAALLNLYNDKSRASADVKSLASKHVADIERKISELQDMRNTLTALISSCHGDDRPDCPILEGLSG